MLDWNQTEDLIFDPDGTDINFSERFPGGDDSNKMTNTTVDSKKRLLQLKKLGSLLDHNENLYSQWDNQY